MELYSFFRSSAAYRVRIALGLKNLAHSVVPVDITAGEQNNTVYRKRNAQGLVPTLKLDDGTFLAQSGAILEWLEETHPNPPLYPADAYQRALHRALCLHIACDIHPLNNLRILRYLDKSLEIEKHKIDQWYAHWIQLGFQAIEEAVNEFESPFSLGGNPGMLEIFLIPQIFNAKRFKVCLDGFPGITALDERCQSLSAFVTAHPSRQIDTPQQERV